MSWDADIVGNYGRWILVFFGLGILLIAFDVPQKLWNKSGRNKKLLDPLSASFTPEQKAKRIKLLELREEGITLHHKRILTPAEYDPWHQQFENWHIRALEAADEVDPELRAILSPLGDFPAWNLGWPVNREHKMAQNMIWETQVRIMKYLDQTRTR